MNMQTEPARIVGFLTAAVSAVIALLVAFGLDIDQTKQAAILGLVSVLAPVVAALIIRSKVWSPASFTKAIDDLQN